jgi:hypothetical protein
MTISVAVEGFRPSLQSLFDQIGVSAHAWSMASYSDCFVGKYLYKSASETRAAFAKSRDVARSNPFFAKTSLAASMIACLRSSDDSRNGLLVYEAVCIG